MKITKGLLRTYRTFNYDYKLKGNSTQETFLERRKAWEPEDDFELWRPWVEVPVSYPICCIVGANESGKSHFMAAIRKLIKRERRKPVDRCRYSDSQRDDVFIGIEIQDAIELESKLTSFPDWQSIVQDELEVKSSEEAEDAETAESLTQLNDAKFKKILLTSKNSQQFTIYVEVEDGDIFQRILSPEETEAVFDLLPDVHTISSEVKLIPRCTLMDLLWVAYREELENKAPTDQDLGKLHGELGTEFPWPNVAAFSQRETAFQPNAIEDIRLIYRLLKHGANYDFSKLSDLVGQHPGMLMAAEKDITENVEKYLRVSHWWSQDVDVKIAIGVESSAVTVATTDRTGTYYDIDERSRGFTSFLGYILQLILVRSETSGPALILSDEPDFALSAVGQRNLLRLFREAAAEGNQLIYSTHSMELIDQNFPHCITVIKKGQYDEGTLTVREDHKGFYEPIRSALGSRILAVPFIDGPNLVVEGICDLRFAVRTGQYLAESGKEYIDLAELSIVVADGCSNMSNIVDQAMSVMGERAYLTVLLDNDEKGIATKVILEAQDQLLGKRKQIIMVSDIHGPGAHSKETEIEDLIPPQLYLEGLKKELEKNGYDSLAAKILKDKEFEKEALHTPLVDCTKNLLARLELDETVYKPNKPNVIDNVFDMLESSDNSAPWKDDFVKTLEKFTHVIGAKIAANVKRLHHEGATKLIHHLLKSHKRLQPEAATKGDILKLLDNLAAVAEGFPHKRDFDDSLGEIKNRSCAGDPDDTVANYRQLMDRLFSVPALLNLDEE